MTFGVQMKPEQHAMTESEWTDVPVTFGSEIAAKVFGCTVRYVQAHAADLGGVKVAGHWVFSKPKTADMLGIKYA